MKFNLKQWQKNKIEHVKENPNFYAHESIGIRFNLFQSILFAVIFVRFLKLDYGISVGLGMVSCLILYVIFEAWQKKNDGTNDGWEMSRDILYGYWTCFFLVPLITFIIGS